jgi:hypothetical protein
VQRRIEPAGIINRACFDERNVRNHSGVREDWRAALWTEVSPYRLPTAAGVMKRFDLSSNGQCWLRDPDQNRESGSGLLLAIFAMANPYKNGISVC